MINFLMKNLLDAGINCFQSILEQLESLRKRYTLFAGELEELLRSEVIVPSAIQEIELLVSSLLHKIDA